MLDALEFARPFLIGFGVLLEIFALYALCRDTQGERRRGPAEHDPHGDPVDLGYRRRRLRSPQPRLNARDFYAIEKTPPGVRPGDLTKTAKVTYVDGFIPPKG
ncbi:MAG: hypothetical protein WDO13_21735 [Verrucomicrobiota bacterium]